ncbi:hypothetical protein [Deinococcus roseus]|nr:hypothetical protein [Deinococcus roseus]
MGEGASASKGVIDDNYLPPWDTWFAFLSQLPEARLLLAWIPEALSEWVQGAIEVGANHPIEWLDVVVTAEDLQPGDGWHEIQGELRTIWQHMSASNSS